MLYLGLDLGQASDYSALAIIEEPIYFPPAGGWVSLASLNAEQRAAYDYDWYAWRQRTTDKQPLWLRTLHRYPLQTPYPDVVTDIIRRLSGATTPVLVVDGTGVGAAVVDMFRYSDLPCTMVKVLIHGGAQISYDRGVHVPKRDLIGAVQAVLHTGQLQVARQSAMTEAWAKEMAGYKLSLTANGHDTYNARTDSVHDDLVLAVALAVWKRGRDNRGE